MRRRESDLLAACRRTDGLLTGFIYAMAVAAGGLIGILIGMSI